MTSDGSVSVHRLQTSIQALLSSADIDVGSPGVAGEALVLGLVAQGNEQHLGQLDAGHVAVGGKLAAADAGDDALCGAGLDVALSPGSVGVVAHVAEGGGGVGADSGVLAAVQGHADHLGDLSAGDVALGLERAVGVTADDVQCSTSIDSLSVLDLGLIRERRPGPYDHDGQHHSHAENQGQNLLLCRWEESLLGFYRNFCEMGWKGRGRVLQ